MKITDLIWDVKIIEKLEQKHNVQQHEVQEAFASHPYFRFVEEGYQTDENVYSALERTNAGRYLIIFFIHKKDKRALILSARDMTPAERKKYEQK